jgi:hypothetical protein
MERAPASVCLRRAVLAAPITSSTHHTGKPPHRRAPRPRPPTTQPSLPKTAGFSFSSAGICMADRRRAALLPLAADKVVVAAKPVSQRCQPHNCCCCQRAPATICEVGVCTVSACQSHGGGGRLAPTHPVVPAAVSASQPCSGGRSCGGGGGRCVLHLHRACHTHPTSAARINGCWGPACPGGRAQKQRTSVRQGAAHGVRCVFAVCRPSSTTVHFWR